MNPTLKTGVVSIANRSALILWAITDTAKKKKLFQVIKVGIPILNPCLSMLRPGKIIAQNMI